MQMLCLIGEAFDDETEEICGAVINVRMKGDKIAVWTRDAENVDSNMKIGWDILCFSRVSAAQAEKNTDLCLFWLNWKTFSDYVLMSEQCFFVLLLHFVAFGITQFNLRISNNQILTPSGTLFNTQRCVSCASKQIPRIFQNSLVIIGWFLSERITIQLTTNCGSQVSYGSRTTCIVSIETVAPLQDSTPTERERLTVEFFSQETPGFVSPEL